jgi:hypothetical protein
VKRAYYQSGIPDFLKDGQEKILGELARHHHFELDIAQKNAWLYQIQNLKEQLADFPFGDIFFEFSIPRMGKRADVVLYLLDTVFVLEYKVGAKTYERHQVDQALDYALDLKNFHAGSHHKPIVPILISTKARSEQNHLEGFPDGLYAPLRSNGANLSDLLKQAISHISEQRRLAYKPAYGLSDTDQEGLEDPPWSDAGYKPTPTIIEAAQALYQGHSVADISRSDAGAKNLTVTTECINKIIENSRRNGRKSICFVTGVPGAGKTLAGLNISTQTLNKESQEHAVFLSGNGPLVAILREALARDEVERAKALGQKISKDTAKQKVSAFIQNIHHFRDEGLKSDAAPIEHVVVFDEAQRAWNQTQAEKFMVQKKGLASFDMSEPEFLISVMDRRQDWCTVICLIGGGQEINTGEAGLIEWFNALQSRFKHWDVYHSGQLSNKGYNWGHDLEEKLSGLNAVKDEDLHLNVSIRSYRAERLSEFVGAIIDGDAEQARSIYPHLGQYEIALTRDIQKAREWLRSKARGTERLGLVASSGAIRLKPEGINIKAEIDPINWFLNGKEDIRSSYYLEDVATEFHVQGLELDWVGVCWDADLRFEDNTWKHYNFKGTKWQNVNDAYRQVYLSNAYRVLLTRARQGMVIFVPEGDERDPTRPPDFYQGIYTLLKNCLIQEIH